MCRIQDRLFGCGRVLQLWLRGVDVGSVARTQSVDVECCDEKIVSHRVLFEAKCRETTRH